MYETGVENKEQKSGLKVVLGQALGANYDKKTVSALLFVMSDI